MPTDAPYPLAPLPLDEEPRKEWTSEIAKARQRIERLGTVWDSNMRAYAPDTSITAWDQQQVNPGVNFYTVEQKKAQLFYDTPTVLLTPADDEPPEMAPQIRTQQVQLNRQLGPEKIDVKTLMDKVCFDILCP